ncbi:MAG: RNA polymerase sigma factor [Xanthomonadales bacterium]|nr:RNA polymerase sigma factor [Xanthomonadales bacterium]
MQQRFNAMVKQHQHRVFTLAVYMLRDRAEAEDVTQETYLKLWQRMEKTQEEVKRAWLLQVTRNACIDRIRKRRPQTNEVPEIEDHRDPVFEMEQDQLGKWLKDAITNLKEPYRSLVIFRDVQQHSYLEIAEMLELSLSQVKINLYRARQQLRAKLPKVETT